MREKEKMSFFNNLNGFGDSYKGLYNNFENLLNSLCPIIFLIEDFNMFSSEIINFVKFNQVKFKIISLTHYHHNLKKIPKLTH